MTENPGGSPSGAASPSMGPPSIPYVPPITLADAVVRARVRIRLRNRRSSRALILSVVFLALPVFLAFAALVPSESSAKVPALAYAYFLGMVAAFLFLGVAIYRILSDRTLVAYPTLAVGALLIGYGIFLVVQLAQLYLAWNPTDTSLPADPSTYLVAMVVPGLIVAAAICAVLGGALAVPRRVHLTTAG